MELFENGTFFIGCNYWASHAGTRMWSDWRPDVVEADLARMKAEKITVLRVFPLWSDFQPLRMHYRGFGVEKELRLGEEPFPHTEAGRAGVSEEMADRFGEFCDLAAKYGIKLIVGLVTGWMSGRLHAPEAFLGRDLLRDPLVLRWQIRFVRYMVRRFRDKPAVAAWDLGNECNCMGTVGRDEAYLWTASIANAIKREDAAHPVVSGMHSLTAEGSWTQADQGELLDVLCTHPYPIFVPHCATEPLNQLKTVLHPTAESVLYASLSGKPCFIEEIGSLGPMMADWDVASDYIRTVAISAWAHDLKGLAWWCAAEQSHLTHTPYDWNAVERELGLFFADGSPKPMCRALTRFMEKVESFPLPTLPPCRTDAVCILTEGQDTWAAAFGTYLLAKKAGLTVTFAWCHGEIPPAPVYILPSLMTDSAIEGHELSELLRRVREEGATLYLSHGSALLSPFSEFTGVKVKTRCRRARPDTVTLGVDSFTLSSTYRLQLEEAGCRVLARDQEGRPAFTENAYGKGKVYFCAYPLETFTATEPGCTAGAYEIHLHRFYEAMHLERRERSLTVDRTQKDAPYIGVTEHPTADGCAAVFVNYTPEARTVQVQTGGLRLTSVTLFTEGTAEQTGDCLTVTLPPNTGAAVLLQKA